MAIDGYFPRITPPEKYDNYRQGDGLGLICTLPNGKKQAFCCDSFIGGEPAKRLIKWFNDNGVTEIDTCIVTHGHGDHFGGFYEMVDSGKLKIKLILSYHPESLRHGDNSTSNGRSVAEDIDNMYKFIRHVQAKGTIVRFIEHGSTVKFGDISFKVYRDQPRSFTEEDQGNGWAFVNNGSLILCSPEIRIVLPGDGPAELEEALDYFNQPIVGMSVPHHGGSCNRPNAKAAKNRGCVIAWESCVEKNGVGTSDHTMYGSRRVKEQGIPVWMQDQDMYIHAANGKITFTQGSKKITAQIPYQGKEGAKVGKWINDNGWKYRNADGSWAHGWALLPWSKGTNWFYFDENGYCVYGWQFLQWSKGPSWFFFDTTSAAMRTGWVYDNGSWYYLNPETGAMQTGWVTYKGKRCYLEPLSDRNHVQGQCYVSRTAVIDGKSYNFDKDGYAEEIAVSVGGKTELDGCDVASYQAGIDFSKMTTTDFAIIKATQGTWYVNPYADIQYSGAKAAGKLLGMYHYAEGKDPIAEAQYFLKKAGSRVGECILALDWEGHDNSKFNSAEEVAWVLKFAMEIYRLTKVHIFLYMSKSVTRRRNWAEVAKDVRLWCAQYANQDHTDYKSNPWTDNGGFGAWKSDTIRQYSSKGRVTGYSKDLDINRAYMSKAEWLAAAAGKNTVVAEKPKTQWSAYVSMTTSPAKISNSGSDEHGNYKNGAAGDQTGKEWRIRDWYNYLWNCVLRHPLAEVRACLATLAVKAAENDNIGYDQNQRDSYGKELANAGYDPSKITKPVESDCSKGVIDNTKATGHILGITELQRLTATYTGNMRAGYKAAGFYVLTDSKYLKNSDYLLAGDILLNDAHHTCTVITNGAKSGNTVVMPLVKRGSSGAAVEQLQEMLIAKGYSCGKWGADGEFGNDTLQAVKSFQRDHGLEVDGEVGPMTWAALIEGSK